jgi:hypothetical protein
LLLGTVSASGGSGDHFALCHPLRHPQRYRRWGSNSAGTGGGVFFAICGLVVLAYSVYRSFRFTRLSRQLRSPANAVRPKKADTIKEVRLALWSNLSGMLLTLIGAEAISGTLLAKSLAQPQALFGAAVDVSRFIQPLDIFVVLANTHATVAHFVGIFGALWLLDRIHKQ